MRSTTDRVAFRLLTRLTAFAERAGSGTVLDGSRAYRCFGRDDLRVAPNVSFHRCGREPRSSDDGADILVPADLAVEVVAPDEKAYALEARIGLYVRHGFGEVWVIHPNVRAIRVHRPDDARVPTFGVNATLTGHGPLQGFAVPVAQLFPAQVA